MSKPRNYPADNFFQLMLTVDPTHCSKLTVALMVQNKNLVLIICDQCFILKTAKQSVKTVSTQEDIFNLINLYFSAGEINSDTAIIPPKGGNSPSIEIVNNIDHHKTKGQLMGKKIKVGLLFGGKSAEHEVSVQSAKNIYTAIDKNKYDVILIGIDKQGRWQLEDAEKFLLHANSPKLIKLEKAQSTLALVPGEKAKQLVKVPDQRSIGPVDVVFPVLHGTFGEDGTMQGLLKLANIPFVGAGVLGSAVGMDKDVMKRLLRDAGIPIPEFLVFRQHEKTAIKFAKIEKQLS
ncbi:MAG: hypothetical protein SCK70_09065, partial [bacterium]|nr:hypothetical protein [bacterium]